MHHPGQSFIGTVVKTAMQKTVKVRIERIKMHPVVLKPVRYHKHFLVHDELSKLVVGDIIKIESCKKISKKKNFTLAEIITPAARYTDETGKLHSQQQANLRPVKYDYQSDI